MNSRVSTYLSYLASVYHNQKIINCKEQRKKEGERERGKRKKRGRWIGCARAKYIDINRTNEKRRERERAQRKMKDIEKKKKKKKSDCSYVYRILVLYLFLLDQCNEWGSNKHKSTHLFSPITFFSLSCFDALICVFVLSVLISIDLYYI